MNDEGEKKLPDEPADIEPLDGAEVEFLTEPGPAPPADGDKSAGGEAEALGQARPGKAKARKKAHEAHPHGEAKELRHEVERLRKALRELEEREAAAEAEAAAREKEAAEYKDKFLRLAAEMDNLRKRLEREKSEFFQYALADLLREILQVVDNFERALKAGDETGGSSLREGVELILKQLLDLLRKQGVVPIVREDRRFDPEVHQAVLTEESAEVGEAVVGEEMQRGFLLNDRLLRPALVKVLLPKKD